MLFDGMCLNGDLRIDEELPYKLHVYEQNHEFVKVDSLFYRKNELWRRKIKKRGGILLDNELLQKNCSLVKYLPAEYREVLGQDEEESTPL